MVHGGHEGGLEAAVAAESGAGAVTSGGGLGGRAGGSALLEWRSSPLSRLTHRTWLPGGSSVRGERAAGGFCVWISAAR